MNLDEVEFLRRIDPGEDPGTQHPPALVLAHLVGMLELGPLDHVDLVIGVDQPHGTRNRNRLRRLVAGDHDDRDAGVAAGADRRFRIGARRVVETDEADQRQLLVRLGRLVRDGFLRQGQGAKTFTRQGLAALEPLVTRIVVERFLAVLGYHRGCPPPQGSLRHPRQLI